MRSDPPSAPADRPRATTAGTDAGAAATDLATVDRSASTSPRSPPWLEANVAGARGAVHVRPHRRRPLQPHLPRHRRRRPRAACCAGRRSATCSPPRTTWAASTGSSPRSADTPVPVPPARRLLRRRVGQRRAVLRDGLRRRHVLRDRATAEADADAPSAPPAPASRSSTRWPPSTPSTSTRSGSATSAATRATSPASSSAGTASGSSRRPASCPPSTRSTTLLPARIPEQGPAHDRPRRLPARQLHGRRRRPRRRRARLGDLHARRPARRRRAAAWSTGPSPGDEPSALDRLGHDGAAASRTGPSCSPATPTVTGRDLVADRLLRRVRASGSWPASSRACTPATSAVPSAAGATRPSTTPFKSQVELAAARAAEHAGAAAMTDPYDAPRGARARRARARRHAHRLDRRRGRGAARHVDAGAGVRRADHRRRSTPTRSSTTGPAVR